MVWVELESGPARRGPLRVGGRGPLRLHDPMLSPTGEGGETGQ